MRIYSLCQAYISLFVILIQYFLKYSVRQLVLLRKKLLPCPFHTVALVSPAEYTETNFSLLGGKAVLFKAKMSYNQGIDPIVLSYPVDLDFLFFRKPINSLCVILSFRFKFGPLESACLLFYPCVYQKTMEFVICLNYT